VDRVSIHEVGSNTRKALLVMNFPEPRRLFPAAYGAKCWLASASAYRRITVGRKCCISINSDNYFACTYVFSNLIVF
jgi:hypothetical protein